LRGSRAPAPERERKREKESCSTKTVQLSARTRVLFGWYLGWRVIKQKQTKEKKKKKKKKKMSRLRRRRRGLFFACVADLAMLKHPGASQCHARVGAAFRLQA